MRPPAVPAVLLALLATACGSTVQSATTRTLGGPEGPGAASDPLGGPASQAPIGGGSGGATTTTLSGGGGTGTSGGSPVAGTSGTAAPGQLPRSDAGGGSALVRAPGVTATEIRVGLINLLNGEALNSAAGAGGLTQGDGKANDKAVIDDINAHGGIAGRKLVPVYADFDSTSTKSIEQQYSAVCQRFTKDQPVFAVVGAGTDTYRSCISRAGTAILSSDLPSNGASAFRKYPGFVELGYPNLDRLAAYLPLSLQEQRYFTPWDTVGNRPAAAGKAKVGILTYGDAVFGHAVDTHLVPGLKRLGYDPVVRKVSQVTTASDYGSQAAAVKSAQLAFASQRVTHVIPFEANAGLSLFFLPTARSQGYFPRFGINSASGFQALMDTGATDAAQVRGTVGYGWLPNLDMPASFNADNGPYANAERRRCMAVYRKAGIVFDSSNAQSIGLATCANLHLLREALDRTPSRITLGTFVTAVGSLGTSYQPAGSLGIDLRPDRHDPSNVAYHWRFFDDCGCFHYEGGRRTVP